MDREEKLFLILSCIKHLNNPVITRIQKTIFIYKNEYDENAFVYVANNFGANSFDLFDEITFLKHNGFIKGGKETEKYVFLQKGSQIYQNLLGKYNHQNYIMVQICNFADIIGTRLVDYVYHWYPKLTTKSLIIDNIRERMTHERKDDAETNIGLLRKKIQKSRS